MFHFMLTTLNTMAGAFALLFFLTSFVFSPLHTFSVSLPSSGGFSLELIHRDSIHSPFFSVSNRNITSISPPLEERSFHYVVRLSIGSGPTDLVLLFDTGSDITWTQCSPCHPCYHQTSPMFEPAYSTSYHVVPYQDSHCIPPNRARGPNGHCHFSERYGTPGSFTSGPVATENFRFHSSHGPPVTIGNIIFGCSDHSTPRNLFGYAPEIGGILGMGRGRVSFISQIGASVQYRFSYCLLPQGQHAGSNFLRFGNDIRIIGQAHTTPFDTHGNPTQYYLNLQDISINNRHLNLPRGTFTRHSRGGGCIIDSGTYLTRLVAPAYQRVVGALRAYFIQYHLHEYRELCYSNVPSGFNAFPTVTFHFQGADLVLGRDNLFMIQSHERKFCLAMLSSPDYTTFGAKQQENFQIVYDNHASTLSFAPADCTRA